MKDLFGEEISIDSLPAFDLRKPTQPNGYAATPGGGPRGETCAGCKHFARRGRYPKCLLVKDRWTHGAGSDIKAKSPACARFEKA
jgi:hypothetical protein